MSENYRHTIPQAELSSHLLTGSGAQSQLHEFPKTTTGPKDRQQLALKTLTGELPINILEVS